jgi:hypothetical protein
MFSYVGLNKAQSHNMMNKWHVYMIKDGCISFTKIPFKCNGFINKMVSNISFVYISICSYKIMIGMDITSVYAYISIIVFFFCLPLEIIIARPKLM